MSEKKRGALAELLGIDDAHLNNLVSPYDAAARGLSDIGNKASGALRPLGAKLDARLGTTAKPRPSRARDPLLTEPPAETPPMGLFEMLGHAVPQVGAAIVGNHAALNGPAAVEGVAAFPTPKQSLKAMKREAVFRDMMESKGARVIEPAADMGPNGVPASEASRRAIADYEFANRNYNADPTPAAQEARRDAYRRMFAETTKDLNRINRGMNEARFANDYMRGGAPRNEAGGGTTLTGVAENDWSLAMPPGSTLDPKWLKKIGAKPQEGSFPNPRARIPAEQSELERYLAGLYGPKAGGEGLSMFPKAPERAKGAMSAAMSAENAKRAWSAPGIATSTPADRTRGYAERLAKIDPKTLKGANDGFPRPGQSLKAMQDESVFRDAMESKGAHPIDPPSVDDLRRRVAPVDDPSAYYDKGGTTHDRWQRIEVPGASHSAPQNASAIEAAAAAHDANRVVSDGMNFWPSHPNLYRPGEEVRDAFRTSVQIGNREARGVMPGGKTRVVPASKNLPGQSELERYLAGLFGPKAQASYWDGTNFTHRTKK